VRGRTREQSKREHSRKGKKAVPAEQEIIGVKKKTRRGRKIEERGKNSLFYLEGPQLCK